MIRIRLESQFDLCSVCGVYAELDDIEGVICYPCAADQPNSLETIEIIAMYGWQNEDSKIGARIAQLRANIIELTADLDAIEAELRDYRAMNDRSGNFNWEVEVTLNDLASLEDRYSECVSDLLEIAPAITL